MPTPMHQGARNGFPTRSPGEHMNCIQVIRALNLHCVRGWCLPASISYCVALVLLLAWLGPSIIVMAPWDQFPLLDSGWRILIGQVPHTDFYNPSGPLTYAFVTRGSVCPWWKHCCQNVTRKHPPIPSAEAQFGFYLCPRVPFS